MEGKNVVVIVVLMSLIMASHIQVDAKSCCPSTSARNIYNVCRFGGGSRSFCASTSGCKIISGNECPSKYTHLALTSGDVDVKEYCKLGCASSVCAAIVTLQDSNESQIVNGAVEQCTNACATICAKGYTNDAVAI